MTVDDVIHVEVKKLFPKAELPSFEYEQSGEDLVIHYSSKRGVCASMDGLIDGVGVHFKQSIEHTQTECKHQGGERCRFREDTELAA